MKAENDITIEKYKAILEISNNLASTLDIDTILNHITESAVELLNANEASILLYDPSKERLFFRSATNMRYHEDLSKILVPKESLAGWVAEHHEAIIIDDVHTDTRFSDFVEKSINYHTQSMCVVPMIVKDKLIGVLEVLNKKSGQFSAVDQEILLALGIQAAIAIENSRLFHQSDTIADLVHELRTPLGAINTITYLLLRPELTQDQKQTFVSTIQEETERLSELVTNFLDFSRLESGREQFVWEPVDLFTLSKECILLVAPKAQDKHIDISIEHKSPESVIASADRNKLKQVLLNLLSNSIKYNKENGRINISLFDAGHMIELVVEDTGVGIAEKDLSELFKKYYRSNDVHQTIQGTGLGLAICKKILENLNASIDIQSKVNIGTKVTVSIPKKG
ncbi:MAG: GAF domain-containing sensor histidine kinase [Anaerolineaceae bacterium]|nr:GAF domain-containing sensor histidine kinase [Anaerolineaceae bacterium]